MTTEQKRHSRNTESPQCTKNPKAPGIICLEISHADYLRLKRHPPLLTRYEIDAKNLVAWNLDEGGRANRKLQSDGLKTDERYRNFDEPAPLL